MIGGEGGGLALAVQIRRGDATTAMVMGNNNQGRNNQPNNQPISDGDEGGLHRG